MTILHLYGETKDGAWKPVRVNDNGETTQATAPTWNYAAASGGITDTSDVVLKGAAVNKANYITSLAYQNKHATTGTEVVIKDGSTVIARYWAPAAMLYPAVIKVDGSLRSSVNTALNAACVTTGTATYVNATGYQEASSDIIQAVFTTDAAGDELFDDFGALLYDDNNNVLYA